MKILFITLSNIGDCILTLPVLDALRKKYPEAQISCLVPARPREIFANNPGICEVIVFDKQASLGQKIKLFQALSKNNFDLVVDLRNSLFGAFLPVRKRSLLFPFLRRIPAGIKHMKDKHLFWANLWDDHRDNPQTRSLNISRQDADYVDRVLNQHNLQDTFKLIVVAPGARSHTKCWDKQYFSQLCRRLVNDGYRIILVGDQFDQPVCDYLAQDNQGDARIINLCAKTNFAQLGYLLKKALVLITNDSAVMHLASYLNVPVVAVFGPTDENKYGPWSQNCRVVKKDIFCRPCAKAQCRFGSLACLISIKPEDVLKQVKLILENKSQGHLLNNPGRKNENFAFKRILVSRTDRLGDVLLSTPVIKALRREFPQSYISMLVSPYTKEVLEGNPDLDEIITLDKNQGWLAGFKFADFLRKKKFDLAIVLHPTTRVHLLIFLARIPKRLGYDRKLGFLLTDRLKHAKQLGEKHESEYALDLVRYLGIDPIDKNLCMPIRTESEKWVEDLFSRAEIKPQDKLLVIHPAASCPSRIWPGERFAEVADCLARQYGFKVIIVSSPGDVQKAKAVAGNMHVPVLNLAGETNISQLASLLRRSHLFISTDSGPMHVATTFGVPVITIFGRNQAGLSPQRWGPLGEKKRILHKTVGCTVCLAHNCRKDFACLKATTVADVLNAARELLL
ncbi:MAG TPA: lipopolysaccharide heptosyltransferase II [Candidatus Omnitrophota bacterium]|nr:lipopolysaccharide heptosyltransferase II [Candidatus Omnitrophota bacterium]HPT38677.1 lipopolysaccharide heptosyltransferase II [Candidatus Omnitrophota bacterium]